MRWCLVVVPLVACRPPAPSLATRLLALAQGLHLPRIPIPTYPHRRAGARWQRPPAERFARAPVLTSYTPLHLEHGFHPSPLLSVTHEVLHPLEDGWAGYQADGQDKVQADNMPSTGVKDGEKEMNDEQEQEVEIVYGEHSNDIDKEEDYEPEDMEATHKDGYTVILPEGPMVEMKKYMMKNKETAMEVTDEPVVEVQEKVEVVEVPVVDLVDVLTEAGVVKLDWGNSIRAAMRGATEEGELYDQPMASKVEEEATYQAFPNRVEVPTEVTVEVSSEPGVEEEYLKMMEMPGVMESGITIEAPTGPLIEDNSLMEFEGLEPPYYEGEAPPPYSRREESLYSQEETRALPGTLQALAGDTLQALAGDTLQALAGDAVFRSPFFQSSGFSQEPFRIPEEFRTFLDGEPTWIIE